MLYVNEPCIVLGKNQSIYKEVHVEFLRNNKLKLCRRISGGGTVYQDEGNLSFSFISKFEEHKINNYKWFNQPVIDALKKLGVEAEMDTRNNILCSGKKISGNAQFTNRKNIISHGTILFDADLSTLRNSLKENDFKIETKAVSSVKSSVMNIKDITSQITSIMELKQYLKAELKANNVVRFTDKEWSLIEKMAEEKFYSFEWIYGRSPATKIAKNGIIIEVENGLIKSIKGHVADVSRLVGMRYEYTEIKKALEYDSNASELLQTIF